MLPPISKLAKDAVKSAKATPGKIKAKPGQMKTQAKAFNHAFKTTPGESLGTHIKAHRVGTAFAAVSTASDAADIHEDIKTNRQSSHGGINQRG